MHRYFLTFLLVILLFIKPGSGQGSSPEAPYQVPGPPGEQVRINATPVFLEGKIVYHLGNGITEPKPLDTPPPNDYPNSARRSRTEGVVILWVIVDTAGHPRDIKVVKRLGRGLDEASIKTVKRWRFLAARKDGQPVAVMVAVQVSWNLMDAASSPLFPDRMELWGSPNNTM
jgi:TonB family protein